MTRSEKKERRRVKHRLQLEAMLHLSRDAKLVMSARQMRIAGRKISDVLLSGKNPAQIVRA
jgi:hypothetical protein